MKTIELGSTIGVFANLGVIVGIIFLAMEVRQNNQLLSAGASQRFVEQRAGALARSRKVPAEILAMHNAAAHFPLAHQSYRRYKTTGERYLNPGSDST